MDKADLHTHTDHSDGVQTPRQVVEDALFMGLRAVAITDHDAVSGVAYALKAAREGIEVVPGVELSSYIGEQSFHIIGLFVDVENNKLVEYLAFFREQRRIRAEKIITILKGLGIPISMDDIAPTARQRSIGRPHIADALVKVGAVSRFEEGFQKYLGHGRPAYVSKHKISPKEAAEIIHGAGGAAIFAHPGVSALRDSQIVEVMGMGIDGVEIAHPLHKGGQESHLRGLALKNGWLMSGGSDSHGPGRNTVNVGDVWVDFSHLNEIRHKLGI